MAFQSDLLRRNDQGWRSYSRVDLDGCLVGHNSPVAIFGLQDPLLLAIGDTWNIGRGRPVCRFSALDELGVPWRREMRCFRLQRMPKNLGRDEQGLLLHAPGYSRPSFEKT